MLVARIVAPVMMIRKIALPPAATEGIVFEFLAPSKPFLDLPLRRAPLSPVAGMDHRWRWRNVEPDAVGLLRFVLVRGRRRERVIGVGVRLLVVTTSTSV